MAQFNPQEHLIDRQGKKFITYPGLQAKLADDGKAIVENDTEILQNGDDHDSGRWIVKVMIKVVNKDGKEGVFRAIGDASPENVGKMIVPHLPRMAETRGEVRALRKAVRSTYTAFEELDGSGNIE